MKSLLLVMIAAITLSACSGKKRINYGGENATVSNEKVGESLAATVHWIKRKRDKVDVMLTLRNHYSHPVFLRENQFQGTYAGEPGMVKKTGRVYDLLSGGAENVILIFEFPSEIARAGDFVLDITHVNEGDMENPGKKLPGAKLNLEVR